MVKNGYCAMKKIAVLLMCLFSSFSIFSETVYKVSRTYIEKGNMGNETSRRTYYFVKNKGILKKYYQEENGRISKTIEMQVFQYHRDSILVMITDEPRICSLYEIKFIGGNSITINDDTYVLEKESHDRLYSNTIASVIHFDIDKKVCDMTGDGFAYPTSNEFTFSEIIKCEKMQESEYKTLFTF